MALTTCLSCNSLYNEMKDRCDKCHKTVNQQIKDFGKTDDDITVSKKLIEELAEEAYIKGYNAGVRKVNNNIILF